MKRSIYLEIEHKELCEILNSDRKTARKLVVSTIEKGQKKALFRIFGSREAENPFLLAVIPVDLPPEITRKPGKPRITVDTHLAGRRLKIKAMAEGKLLFDKTISAGRLFGYRRVILTAAGILAAGLLLLLAVLYLPQLTDADIRQAPAVPEIIPDAEDETPAALIKPDPPPEPDREVAPEPAAPESVEQLHSSTLPFEPVQKEIRFDPDSAVLMQEAIEELSNLIQILQERPDTAIEIDGHCAVRGSETGRIRLSRQRAENVGAVLINAGISRNRIAMQWFGSDKPVTFGDDEQHLNRRVEIRIVRAAD